MKLQVLKNHIIQDGLCAPRKDTTQSESNKFQVLGTRNESALYAEIQSQVLVCLGYFIKNQTFFENFVMIIELFADLIALLPQFVFVFIFIFVFLVLLHQGLYSNFAWNLEPAKSDGLTKFTFNLDF